MIEIDPALMRQAMAALTHIPEGGPKALASASRLKYVATNIL